MPQGRHRSPPVAGDRGLRGRPGARHPRPPVPAVRRLAARRQHAGDRVSGLCRDRGARLCDPGRCQVPVRSVPAPSPGAGARRGDRGHYGRARDRTDHRPGAGAAMIQPTRRAIVLVSAAAPLSLAVAALDADLWPIGLSYLLFVLALIAFDSARALPTRRLTVAVRPIDSLFIGEPANLEIALTADWPNLPHAIEARLDIASIVDTPPLSRAALAPENAVSFQIPLRPLRRGMAEIEALWLRWGGTYGLVERRYRMAMGVKLHILPSIRAARGAALHFTAIDSMLGVKAQRELGTGSEFDALRDYMPGLDRRTIDWKHSARHYRLVSKEFRTERNHQIILAFDTGHLMQEPLAGMPKLDHAINAGLMLSYVSLKAGDRVGMMAFDAQVDRYVEPVGGVQIFNRLRRQVAEIEYSAVETNFTLGLTDLMNRLNRRSLIILMTEFVDTVTAELMVENVARLANRHLVLFVTLKDPQMDAIIDQHPHAFREVAESVAAEDMRRDRLVVLERLRRLGVQCLEAPHDRFGTDLLNRYLDIKRRELI